MNRAVEVVAQTQRQIELRRNLPVVGNPAGERGDIVNALRVADGDAGLITRADRTNKAGQEVSQGFGRRRNRGVASPGAGGAIEVKGSAKSTLIVNVQPGQTVLTAHLERMGSHLVGQVVGEVAGGIGSAQFRCFADAAVGKAVDVEVGRAEITRVGDAGVEAQARHVEAVVRIVKVLLEKAHAQQQLVDQLRCKYGVQLDRQLFQWHIEDMYPLVL